jgi:hypothetical protein
MVIAVILSLITVIPVMATSYPYITNFKATYSDDSSSEISLNWSRAVGYDQTFIRQSATGYPTSPTGGDGITVYPVGTSVHAISIIVKGLTPGTTYYYTAWGYDSATSTYSADGTAPNAMLTTTAGAGAADILPTPVISTPVAPSSGGWLAGLQPFSGFVQGFENAWGMATNTMPFTIGVLILLVVGVGVYLKTKSPFIAIVADFAVDLGLVALGLLSPYTIGVVLAFGLGIWALENIWI